MVGRAGGVECMLGGGRTLRRRTFVCVGWVGGCGVVWMEGK